MLWPFARAIHHPIQPSSAAGKKRGSVPHLVAAKRFLSHTTVSNACVAFIMEGCEGNGFDERWVGGWGGEISFLKKNRKRTLGG